MFFIKNLTTIKQEFQTDVVSELGVPILRKSPMAALMWPFAKMISYVWSFMQYINRESNPFTAVDSLQNWAALKGLTMNQATQASGPFMVTFYTSTTLVANSTFTSNTGTVYQTTVDLDGTAGSTVTITATSTTAGASTNLPSGSVVSLTTPVPGINNVVLTGAIAGGADTETTDNYRARMLQVYAEPPVGGATAEFQNWAQEVPGVTRAWCIGNGYGIGSALIYVMLDNNGTGGFPNGTNGVSQYELRDFTVATGDQLLVADHIFPLRPVTSLVWVASPGAQTLNVTIQNLSPYTTAMQSQVSSAISNALLQYGTAAGGVINLNLIEQQIQTVSGIQTFDLITPDAPITLTPGLVPVLGTITYV